MCCCDGSNSASNIRGPIRFSRNRDIPLKGNDLSMNQSRESAEATSFAEAFEASLNFKTPEVGELLRGSIVSIQGEDAFVSYGGPSEAVMATAELDGLEVGDEVEGTVVKSAPDIRISRKLAKGKASLEQLRQMFENRLPVEGKVSGRNKGGFEVN